MELWVKISSYLSLNFFGCLDFYEETFTLIDTLTINTISPLMWQVFYLIKEAFFRDASDYFAGKIDDQ